VSDCGNTAAQERGLFAELAKEFTGIAAKSRLVAVSRIGFVGRGFSRDIKTPRKSRLYSLSENSKLPRFCSVRLQAGTLE
jgi:hypothetical protein